MSRERDPSDPYDIKGSQRDTEVLGCMAVAGVLFFVFLIVCDIIYMVGESFG